ncbi:hypothetical protein [Microbacterium karelineae]|uniref:hypothetical protein n=1 Tax=Microbacterium karelineae TaxID=2654283 RepID=UPI0012EA13FF|nr:hypothetical protein [Microbacterium karelineae]
MPTTEATHSGPTITRSQTESVIEFDIRFGATTAWESIRIRRDDDGLTIDGRATDVAPLHIPTSILPSVLAEMDRLATGDDIAPFAPVAAIDHVRLADVGLGRSAA